MKAVKILSIILSMFLMPVTTIFIIEAFTNSFENINKLGLGIYFIFLLVYIVLNIFLAVYFSTEKYLQEEEVNQVKRNYYKAKGFMENSVNEISKKLTDKIVDEVMATIKKKNENKS